MSTGAQIQALAEEAFSRVQIAKRRADMGRISKEAVALAFGEAARNAKDKLEAETTAAIPAEKLHNEIIRMCVEAGLAQWRGQHLYVAA